MVVDDTTNLLSICEGIYKVFTGNCCRNGGNENQQNRRIP